MKKIILTAALTITLAGAFNLSAYAMELELGGQTVGIQVATRGVSVAGISKVETGEESVSPAEDAGIMQGDRIMSIGGTDVDSAAQVSQTLEQSGGDTVDITLCRDGETKSFSVSPVQADDGRWMLGILLREGVSGIGTVTFVDPESGIYGALGHGISDGSTGEAVPITSGTICDAQIVGIVPGTPGSPGELNGCSDPGIVLGTVEKNTACGIYGRMRRSVGGQTAELGQMCPGPATFISTIQGREQDEYTVEINRIVSDPDGVHAMLTVTDHRLLTSTGGIVQGMSGSPVLQNGKLVGAVTHVFVSDPTRGCAIGIYDMLDAAGIEAKAA